MVQETSGFLTSLPTKTKIFCLVYNYARKVDLGKGYWNPKRKLGAFSKNNKIETLDSFIIFTYLTNNFCLMGKKNKRKLT